MGTAGGGDWLLGVLVVLGGGLSLGGSQGSVWPSALAAADSKQVVALTLNRRLTPGCTPLEAMHYM